MASYQRALAVKPDFAEACSNLVFCLNYSDKVTAAELFEAHRDRQGDSAAQVSGATAYANKREPGRRLKVGYVSPNFRQHSVAYFIEPLTEQNTTRQAGRCALLCRGESSDAVAVRLAGPISDHWLVTVGLSDDLVWPSASGPMASIS